MTSAGHVCALLVAALQLDAPAIGPFAVQVDGLAVPVDVAVDADERIWVLEELAARIASFEADGAPLASFGSFGSGVGELCDPRGLALAPDGTLWVADTGNDRIAAFARDGRPLASFGVRGSAPGELAAPEGLFVDREHVWVADTGNDRVQVFTHAGELVRAFGERGRTQGRFVRPVDVAVAPASADTGRGALVFVVERDNHRVQAFAPDGTFVRAWGDKGPHIGLFEAPSGLALHGERLYVADRDNHRIQEFSLTGRVLDEWGRHALAAHEGRGRFHYPERIALAPSGRFAVVCEAFEDRFQVYVEGERPETTIVDVRGQDPTPHYGSHVAVRGDLCAIVEPARPSVLVFDLSTGAAIEITRIAQHGRGFGQLLAPTDVEIHPDEPLLYVADAGNERLSVFRLQREPGEALRYDPLMGRFVKSLDLTEVGGSGAPVVPVALEFGPDGELFVLDGHRARVLVLDRDLAPLGAEHGPGPGELARPTDLALSPDGQTVWVVDAGTRTLEGFDRAGRLCATIDGFTRPWGVCAAGDGTLFVSDEGAHEVRVFAPDGVPLARFGSRGLGRVEFAKPRGLDLDARGQLFVLDHGNHRAQVLTREGGFVEAFGPRFFVVPTLGAGRDR